MIIKKEESHCSFFFPISGVSRRFILIVLWSFYLHCLYIMYTCIPHHLQFFPNLKSSYIILKLYQLNFLVFFIRQLTHRVTCSTLLSQGILCLSASYKTKKHPDLFLVLFLLAMLFLLIFVLSHCVFVIINKKLIVSNCWGHRHPIQIWEIVGNF